MFIDEFVAQRITSNEAAVRQAERPAQTIGRHWHADARARRARASRRAPSWLRLFHTR
jgi:hypothetical protein